eukprot:TRINITY_DN13846_c0_g1_i1.p1 TRINITY_DN13846_c0_g1~~TRINITY_DN13846_c0_g1_i1.p1  ORF type:complete len:730 (-),score=62.01 TRINITY_DN13846_c0_g1_i1:419-2608(-)
MSLVPSSPSQCELALTPVFTLLLHQMSLLRALLIKCLLNLALFSHTACATGDPLAVNFDDIVRILSSLHTPWPPLSTPPPSNIRGLTLDTCNGTSDCKAPRSCINCAQPPCFCAKAPNHAQFDCNSTADCEQGEFCGWEPLYGFTSGFCVSSNNFRASTPFPILHTPLTHIPSFEALGLTGDRCFSHAECRGARSCLGKNNVPNSYQTVTTCESSKESCVCTPAQFAPCSIQSPCQSSNEVCGLIDFNSSHTISLESSETVREAVLPPLCVSSVLSEYDRVTLVNESSSFHTRSSTAVVINSTQEIPSLLQLVEPASPLGRPFSVPPGSRFNSFSANELSNDFINGILSLIILAQLHKFVRAVISASKGIHHHAYSSFIIYSRLCSLRNIRQMFTCRERLPGAVRGEKTAIQAVNLKVFLLPLLALILLYVAEFVTIVAGTQATTIYGANENFDPVLSVVNGTPRPRIEDARKPDCDDFFWPQSGLHQSGKVFKCVSLNSDWSRNKFRNLIQFRVFYGSGETGFRIYAHDGRASELIVSTGIRTTSGKVMRTMPFRAELMSEQARKKLLNGILNAFRARLGRAALNTNLTLWYATEQRDGDRLVQLIFGHKHDWDESLETLTEMARIELRRMDLVLNSSGAPWVYSAPYTFSMARDVTIATRRQYRISQGWLMVAAGVVSVVYVVVNTYVTHFDDVAYTVMKELIGDDCVLGPLADNSEIECREIDLRL